MRYTPLALLSIVPLVAACDNSRGIADPVLPTAPTLVAEKGPGAKEHRVQMLDNCDPATFNAVIGPGTCVSKHPGTTWDAFIAQLAARQDAPAWRNAPVSFTADFGTTLVAINRGGEVHSFTRVAAFGGGIIPDLNGLSGTPVPAPECLGAPPSEYIGPGGQDEEAIDAHGTVLYQCCIHPWMRTTVTVKN